ncbi:nitroreductase [Levilactobacillus acidifarinae]|uniref:Nitroreductase n=1 Tax=Levilactobacillus acidifarinae DSM 19394 = JCM 15949 TaxID=1423715 RepID=A0A0R1LJZ0_9LACO|nr:nitroreductase [Levilactobacillus acidifarinae]KRK95880.1 nitroreductase [Levilactobacillus acidifarinae DSM 19394]GEO69180.1 nitrobenzoate reductase [Levilactobacillus acidifarinae]
MSDQSILTNRHSARDFSDRPVDLETLKAILYTAQNAPSWENTQPWKAYLALGDTVDRIHRSHRELTGNGTKGWTEVMPPKVWASMPQANMDAWRQNMLAFFTDDEKPRFAQVQQMLFNAPAIVYLTMPKDASAYSAYDLGAFGYGILLAAEEHGVSGVPAYELVRYPAEIRQEFDIPADEAIFMGIALGYPKDNRLNQLRTKRTPLDDILQVRQ